MTQLPVPKASSVHDGCNRLNLFTSPYSGRLTMQVDNWIVRMIGVSGLFVGGIFIGPLFDDVFHLRLSKCLKLEKCITKSSAAKEQAEKPFALPR